MKKKTIAEFVTKHGGDRIRELEKQLAAEHSKVDALSDARSRIRVETSKDCQFSFAAIGDTHVGSLYFNQPAFLAFYEYATKARGVKRFYHTGDVLAGHRMFRGQEFETRDLGLDAQVKRFALVVPVPKGKAVTDEVCFIVGNHDLSFKSLAGVSVGQTLQDAAPGWKYLGAEQARVEWKTPNGPFTLAIQHPGGGTAYAISYSPQKIVDSLEGGTKPDMLLLGHYHKAEFLPSYRNVAVCQTGTFERQSPFMARRGLAAHVGGWIFDVTVGKGHHVIRGEFVAFYV